MYMKIFSSLSISYSSKTEKDSKRKSKEILTKMKHLACLKDNRNIDSRNDFLIDFHKCFIELDFVSL